MRALKLTTRFRDGAYEADACLLAYDEVSLSGAILSADVRDVLDQRPNTPWIYVIAPFHDEATLAEAVFRGTGVDRSSGRIKIIQYRRRDGDHIELVSISLNAQDTNLPYAESPLSGELIQGWLFDFFDSRRARVDAPPGVHFGKASGKHASKFLRTSNVLLSTVACGVVGFFALAKLPVREIRRIFVDTAPLLSVAFAMHRIAALHAFWPNAAPAQSFSSYGGLEHMPSLGRRDLVLISASTSGNLATRLIGLGVEEELLLTLFLLASSPDMMAPGSVVCDLTFKPGRPFGYPMVVNQPHDTCTWCKQGYVLAQLEGDQFLLEKRGIKRLRVSTASQTRDARATFELIARQNYIAIDLFRRSALRTNLRLDVDRMLVERAEISGKFIRLLKRFTPVPLNYVVLVGICEKTFDGLVEKAGMTDMLKSAIRVQSGTVEEMPPVDGGNVLVVSGCLSDHAEMRSINAQLRIKAKKGCVAYLSAITVADSDRNMNDLRMFLGYGEFGAETFICRSSYDIMLPWVDDLPSAWDDELALLQRMDSDSTLTPGLKSRLQWLLTNPSAINGLFLPGSGGELCIAADFVYLRIDQDSDKVSQADIYAVISNLLATVRCDDVGLQPQGSKSPATSMNWKQTVYGQVLIEPAALSPRNLRDYNDSILRAAFLRCASKQELNFSVDEECSAEVFDVLLADLNGWPDGRGDSLPEFLMALACGRLKLTLVHLNRFRTLALAAGLPPELAQLVNAIPEV